MKYKKYRLNMELFTHHIHFFTNSREQNPSHEPWWVTYFNICLWICFRVPNNMKPIVTTRLFLPKSNRFLNFSRNRVCHLHTRAYNVTSYAYCDYWNEKLIWMYRYLVECFLCIHVYPKAQFASKVRGFSEDALILEKPNKRSSAFKIKW